MMQKVRPGHLGLRAGVGQGVADVKVIGLQRTRLTQATRLFFCEIGSRRLHGAYTAMLADLDKQLSA
ncbi:MAG: hypothetical protein ACRYGP_24275 [Janthinobacterium lividum]